MLFGVSEEILRIRKTGEPVYGMLGNLSCLWFPIHATDSKCSCGPSLICLPPQSISHMFHLIEGWIVLCLIFVGIILTLNTVGDDLFNRKDLSSLKSAINWFSFESN